MSEKKRVPFILVRSRNFLKQLFSSKLAITGLIFLLFFAFIALAAPILTPYSQAGSSRTGAVAGPLSQPSWVTLFEGNAGLSGNVNFAGVTATSGTGVSLQPPTPIGPNSIDLQISTNQAGTVLLKESINYPYSGAPVHFTGGYVVTPSGTSTTGSITVAMFIDRFTSDGQLLKRYCCINNQTVLASAQFSATIDSYSSEVTTALAPSGLVTGAGTTPPQFIFSAPGHYDLVLQLTLPAGFNGKLSVQNFGLNLFGNTWGILGTDASGLDIFSQFVYGARLSLYVGLLATVIGIGLGLVIGLMAGYLGKVVDEVLMRFTDMMLVIPALPLLIVLSFVLGPSINTIVIILGFLGWMGFARLIRSQVLSLRERPFIESAKASGAGTAYILARHIFPNIIALTYVNLALSVPTAIVSEAALSFLGLGDPTKVTWGQMLDLSREAGVSSGLSWWWILPPGLGIAILSLSFILIGYSLDEQFNPRLRRRR